MQLSYIALALAVVVLLQRFLVLGAALLFKQISKQQRYKRYKQCNHKHNRSDIQPEVGGVIVLVLILVAVVLNGSSFYVLIYCGVICKYVVGIFFLVFVNEEA